MKRGLLFLLSLTCTLGAESQTITGSDPVKQAPEKIRFYSHRVPDTPYVIVDSFATDLNHMLIGTNAIKELKIVNQTDAYNIYGVKARQGAVVITTKPGTTLLRLNQILDKYNLSAADRKLRVCINHTLIRQPELLLAAASEILTVEITTYRYWLHAEDANSNEKFINIKSAQKNK